MRQFIPGIILFGILLFIPGTNAFATTFQYDFFGTANVTDSGYELGTGAPTQLSFHGSFQLDPLTTSNNPMPVSDFKLQIDQYLFYFDQSGDLCWDFYDIAPQKRSIVGSMGFNSTLVDLLDEHWFEVWVHFEDVTPTNLSNLTNSFIDIVCGTLEDQRNDVYFQGQIDRFEMRPVPEPGTVMLLSAGLIMIVVGRRSVR